MFYFIFFFVEYVWHVLFYCVCYFSLQWKGTYSSTNQSLHIRVTINCFCLIIQIVLIFAFVLFFFSLNVAHKKLVSLSSFPKCLVYDFHFVFVLDSFVVDLFLFTEFVRCDFPLSCSCLVAYFVCCILKKFHIYNSLSNICLEKTNWWKNERLHFDLACNLLI